MKRKNSKLTLGSFVVALILLAIVGYFQLNGNSIQTVTSTPETVVPTTLSGSTQYSDGVWYKIYFTNPGSNEPQVQTHLIKLIDEAKTSVDATVFDFDLEDVTQALIRARARGVRVRVVYDNLESEGSAQIAEVMASGIPMVPDNRTAFMHNKFFIIDGNDNKNAVVWTGSFNISVNAANKNNENAVEIHSQELAQNYTIEFEEMFINHEFGPTSPKNTKSLFDIDGTKVENYFGSEDGVMVHLVELVNSAKSTVHFMAFSFTDDGLGTAMINRYNNGINIEGIFEAKQAPGSGSECPKLLSDGLSVRLDGNPYTFHHKVIIVDEKIVVFGSYNFSASAEHDNDENLLIVYNQTFAQAFEQEFTRMWAQAVVSHVGCKSN